MRKLNINNVSYKYINIKINTKYFVVCIIHMCDKKISFSYLRFYAYHMTFIYIYIYKNIMRISTHLCEIDYFSYFILLKSVGIIMSKLKINYA